MSDSTVTDGLTPEEINVLADRFKNEGNEHFKKGKTGYSDALRLYQRALELKCTDNKVNAAAHGNLAAAYLNMNKFVECVEHAKKSLSIDPNNVKVYWRGARASMGLELWKIAIEFCDAGLAIQGDNDDLLKCKEASQQRLSRAQNSRKEQDSLEAKRKLQAAANDVSEVTFDADEAEDLQSEINVLAKQVAAYDAEVSAAKRRLVKADLTAQELMTLPSSEEEVEDKKIPDLYIQHGKAFFLTSRTDVNSYIAIEKSKALSEIPKIEEMRDALEARCSEKETRLRGMVKNMQRRQAEGERLLPDPQELAARRSEELKKLQKDSQQ